MKEKQQIVKIINEYLALMPNAARYNVCRQQETRRTLELLLSKEDSEYGKLLNPQVLQAYLKEIRKWDGVSHEPEDVSFQLLLLDVQIELKSIRTKLGNLAQNHNQ
jgi:hypothetical protein